MLMIFIYLLKYDFTPHVDMSQKVLPRKNDDYMKCLLCQNPFPHCHCKCPYCGLRDECECALFDAATGG